MYWYDYHWQVGEPIPAPTLDDLINLNHIPPFWEIPDVPEGRRKVLASVRGIAAGMKYIDERLPGIAMDGFGRDYTMSTKFPDQHLVQIRSFSGVRGIVLNLIDGLNNVNLSRQLIESRFEWVVEANLNSIDLDDYGERLALMGYSVLAETFYLDDYLWSKIGEKR